MKLASRMLCLALAIFGSAAMLHAQKPGTVNFRGKSYDSAAPPEDFGPAAKLAVKEWAGWAKTHGYRLDLDPSRRVLLLSTKGNVDAAMGLIVKTIALFDGILPGTLAAAPATAVAPAPRRETLPPDEIPEDPETPPPGAPKTLPAEPEEPIAVAKVEQDFRPDSRTAVMLIANKSADYTAALDHLSSTRPYLEDWKFSAAQSIGFMLEEPLCGAFNENSPGQEEWNPDNELVHRILGLLVLRRFSSQPHWLQTGLCWYAEMNIAKSIYCMPYRDGFVGIGEHDGWLAALNSIYSNRAKDPLKITELALTRAKWDDKQAKTAFGMADYLVRVNPRALAGLMEELRRFRDLNGRKTHADGSWTRLLDYEVPLDQQKLFLQRYFGADVLSEAITYWTSGAIAPVK